MVRRKKFDFIDDVATADAAYNAYGDSLKKLLENAAAALFATMVELERIAHSVSRDVSVEGDDREELLYNWLAELVYLKDVHGELYSSFDISLNGNGPFQIKANVKGSGIAILSEHTSCDVKAVTYHRLAIEEVKEGLKATVVLDL